MRASAASPRARERPTSTSRAPLPASLSAVSNPIPEVAPVITQIFPSMPAIVRPGCFQRRPDTKEIICRASATIRAKR